MWDGVPLLAGGCEHWELISFLPTSAIPPVIMNMLEKRAFLKVPVNLGWVGIETPTKLGTLLTPLRAGTLLGNRCLPTLCSLH